MNKHSLFLSVILVVRNYELTLEGIISNIIEQVSSTVNDYEIIIVDNASDDQSLKTFHELTKPEALPNLQIFCLTKEVRTDVAVFVGLENALGDFIVVIDPLLDDIIFLPEMLDNAVSISDIVFANNQHKIRQSLVYSMTKTIFDLMYRLFSGINLEKEASQYMLLKRSVVNFILQNSQSTIAFRHLLATSSFKRTNLEYSAAPLTNKPKKLGESINKSIRLLVSTTQAPMRLVTSLTLFGAISNVLYSVYVVGVGVLKTDIAPGWMSMSLQQSGMFFLISLVLLVLSEYILHMTIINSGDQAYHITKEFTSSKITHQEKLNIEDLHSSTNNSNNSDQVLT
jgi:polyisoprenyl-phosphate glycosyltransferase